MLSNAGLSKPFWAEAITHVCHLINRLSSSAIEGKTLLEAWTVKIAQDYDSLQIFGCPAYYHVKEKQIGSESKKRCVHRVSRKV